MEEKILEQLTLEEKGYTAGELYDLLHLSTTKEFTELVKALNKLEDELKVYHTKKDRYMLFKNSHQKIGILLVNKKGFGFVNVDNEKDIYVKEENLNHGIHGDKVVVEVTSKKGEEPEGRIVRIIERNLKQFVGEYYTKNKQGYIKLDDEKVKLTIEVDKELSLGAVDGHKVLVKLQKKLKGNCYKGQILKILGHKNDPGVDILSIAAKYDIEETFGKEVENQVRQIPMEVKEEEMVGRRDLRDQMIFTIDGKDTKDIDDAISIQKMNNGNYLLGVHIADVSYYVKENTPLDDEAFSRGTSVYLADRVIPMLPHELSNGICSLNPEEDRLAMSCEMEINSKGEVVTYDIFESVIRSRKQMNYTDVNQILEKGIVPEGYEEYKDTLCTMFECAKILRKNKESRGYIDFDIDEAKIIVDETGEAIDVKVRERGAGEKLIEDFMIVANETVATHIYFMELPFIYRIHGKPSEEKIHNFFTFVHSLGYTINENIREITPKTMQKILMALKDKKEFHILSTLLLRSMQKAVYDTNNIGHFGLASKCYTHFTSPIRRYPDTTVHRMLRKYLFENKMSKEQINYYEQKLAVIALHSSERERASVDCEREVTDMKMAEYMMKHIGEVYKGMISGVNTFGLFIELPNLIEGLIKVDDMKDDHYIYEEESYSLKGVHTKKVYRLGDEVMVKVKNANKQAKTIDFVFAEEKDTEVLEIGLE